ncbi:MAG: pre-tRNA nuclear export protein [Bogoriella megaspora]|nr:MAG: pre-tRNA nuclear export protein [Bogoriella megaspora]
MSSEENDQSADAIFSSQLYLFEAVGCIASTPTVPTERKVRYAGSVINPLTKDIELHVSPATGGDQQAILQIHHDIMALGTLARGYSDWNPNVASSGPPPAQEVSEEFMKAAEIILSALETLNGSMDIRSASRFAFSRLIGVLGARVLQQLQRWIDGLLSQSSTKDEIGTFLRLLDQVVFGFKTEISGILDSLLTPLLQRVFTGLAEPTLGTDDEVQLGELKREYLNFLLIVLNNDLGAVLVSSINQPIFETIITTIEHFSRDTTDYSTARLALSVADKMCLTWGGPTISNSYTPASNEPQPIIITTSAPTLPGFDTFMIHRFSPLSWSIPSSPAFNAKDPQARQVVAEIATLQQNILAKTGDQYLTYLRDVELKNMGAGMDVVEQYLSALTGMDVKAFRVFLNTFVGRGG